MLVSGIPRTDATDGFSVVITSEPKTIIFPGEDGVVMQQLNSEPAFWKKTFPLLHINNSLQMELRLTEKGEIFGEKLSCYSPLTKQLLSESVGGNDFVFGLRILGELKETNPKRLQHLVDFNDEIWSTAHAPTFEKGEGRVYRTARESYIENKTFQLNAFEKLFLFVDLVSHVLNRLEIPLDVLDEVLTEPSDTSCHTSASVSS